MIFTKKQFWGALGLVLLAGPTVAATITCDVTPGNWITVEGEPIRLRADCTGALKSIDWRMNGISVTGVVALSGHTAGRHLEFVTEVGAGSTDAFEFTVAGVPASTANTFGGSSVSYVVVKPSSAVVALAAGIISPTVPVAAKCGPGDGGPVSVMPRGALACVTGSKPQLAISSPSGYSWTCESLTGGADASCYANRGGRCGPATNVATVNVPSGGRCAEGSTASPITTTSTKYSWSCSLAGFPTASCSAPRSYAVTAMAGSNGTVSPASKVVVGGTASTFTVTPKVGYTATVTGCGGVLSGAIYTTGKIAAACKVSATFAPTTSVNGTCGPAANVATLVPPPSHRCAAGNTAGPIITTSTKYSWSCSGTGSGTTASCSAPRSYAVTATAGAGGTITPASRTVAAYTATTFTVAPAAGYTATVTGCNGTLSGNTYTTGQVYANCSVTATFR